MAQTEYKCDKCGGVYETHCSYAAHWGGHKSGIQKQELLESLETFADEVGGSPTVREMDEKGPHSASAYKNAFDTWNNALEAAGLDLNKRDGISGDELISEIRRLRRILNRPPYQSDLEEHCEYGRNPFARVFGSWSSALEAAGYEPHMRGSIPDQELLADLERLNEVLGYPPRAQDIERIGKFSASVYLKRFGGIIQALDRAGLDNYEAYRRIDVTGGGLPFGPNWEEKRKQALERDGYACQLCLKGEKELEKRPGHGLCVHHKTPRREFIGDGELDYEAANELDNLIPLCQQCHMLAEARPGVL